jgi:hypothetical protein
VVTVKSTTTANEFSQRMDAIPGGYPATELIGVEEGARGEHEDGSQNFGHSVSNLARVRHKGGKWGQMVRAEIKNQV